MRNTGFKILKKMQGGRTASYIGLLICAVFSSAFAHAENVGGIRVLSALNQPLHAQLVLEGNSRLHTECARADIESMDGESIGTANVRIADDGSTQTLTLASQDAIREPAVNVVVQTGCNTSEEHIYPVLLDLVQPEASMPTAHINAAADPMKALSAVEISQEMEEGTKLQLTPTLSAMNLLAVNMDVDADSKVNSGDGRTHSASIGNPVSANNDVVAGQASEVGAHNWLHRYWRTVLGIFAVSIGALILSFLRSTHRVSRYPQRRSMKRATTTQGKPRVSSAALDPIPYAKPDMNLIASLNTMPPRATVKSESQSHNMEPIAASVAQADNRIAEEANARPPLYSVEEIIDEAQLAKLCMGLNQPLRAIEILEVYLGQKQPNTPLPWQCLLELYRNTGDLNKYRELISRFNSAFGDQAGKRVERTEHADENRRMRA
jgi:hypothetical protein